MPSPALTTEELAALSAATIAHYDGSAESFEAATRNHDVSQNYAALLGAIEAATPLTILDVGCGPGRDLAWFKAQGHVAVGVEGSLRFIRGTVGAARRSNKDSGGSQFFVAVKEQPQLLGQYTIFGEVVSGMEVVDQISMTPVDDDKPRERVEMKVTISLPVAP